MSVRLENTDEVSIKVVVLYDALDSGCRAKSYLDRLQLRSRGALQIAMKLWRFDMVELLQTQEVHSENTAHADMVIVTLQPGGVVPGAVLGWLEEWARHREVEDAALVLLQQPGEPEAGMFADPIAALRELAELHGLSFQREWGPDSDRRHLRLPVWPQGTEDRYSPAGRPGQFAPEVPC